MEELVNNNDEGSSSNDETSIVHLLANTDEQLKGQLKPAELVVDKQTLVDATRVQNQALIFIYSQLQSLNNKLDGVEANLTRRIDEVDIKLGQWGDRINLLEEKSKVCVETISACLIVYLATLTHSCVCYSIQSHDEALAEQDVINKQAEEFKSETNKDLGDTRDCLKVIDTAVKDLPNTLQLSATQIYIRNDDTDAEDNDDTSPDAPTVHDSLHLHTHQMNELEVQTSSEINRVVEWVTNQKQNDETKLNALAETVEQVQLKLQDSVSQTEVDEKISLKVRELVDQIKEALLTVEDEEADFKNVASTLHALFNSLKESKADKSEMNQLRNQIINTQLNGGGGSDLENSNGVGGTLDYKGLRKILSSYSKTDLIKKQLEGKADKDLIASRLAHSSNMIDKILETIQSFLPLRVSDPLFLLKNLINHIRLVVKVSV